MSKLEELRLCHEVIFIARLTIVFKDFEYSPLIPQNYLFLGRSSSSLKITTFAMLPWFLKHGLTWN